MVRNGTSWKLYINGSEEDSVTQSYTIFSGTAPLTIGTNFDFTKKWDGYMDELRISRSIARWTEPFTPFTGPYTVEFGF